jgi:hypothetical protein
MTVLRLAKSGDRPAEQPESPRDEGRVLATEMLQRAERRWEAENSPFRRRGSRS